MTRRPPSPAVAALAFAVLGAVLGYTFASAYVTQRFGGSAAHPDLLFLLRNLASLRVAAPRELLLAGLAVATGASLGAGLVVTTASGRLTRYGSTAWQGRRAIRRNGFLGRPEAGFILGKLGPPRSRAPFLVSTTFPHALVVAPTGRGKGVGFVIPNLLAFAGSVVVLDVKGENFEATSRRRWSMGDAVIRFAPADWSGRSSHRYNPLDRIAALKNPAQQMMELRLTASLFLQPDSPATAGLLQGGIDLFVAAGMLAIQRGQPTLGEVYRIAVGGGDKQATYAELSCEARYPPARLILRNLASINDRTLTSYLSVLLTSGLDAWSNPAIDAVTAASDFSFRDLRRHPHAVYLEVAPDTLRPLAPLIRLFFGDLIASLQSREPAEDERFRVLVMLDEFDRLGRMPIVAESIKTLRSYGGHLALVTQTIPALDEIYGENGRLSIQGGAGVKVYLTPSDRKTIAELSASLGGTTRRVVSRSRSLGLGGPRGRTLTERTEPSPLLTEDEVRTMGLDEVVLVIDAQDPIRARRVVYHEDRLLARVHGRQSGPWPYPDPATVAVGEEPEDDGQVDPATRGPQSIAGAAKSAVPLGTAGRGGAEASRLDYAAGEAQGRPSLEDPREIGPEAPVGDGSRAPEASEAPLPLGEVNQRLRELLGGSREGHQRGEPFGDDWDRPS